MVTHNQARFFLRFTPNFLKTFWIEEDLTLKVIIVCFLPVSKIDVFFDPRSHGGAVKYFSKIQKHLYSAFFVVSSRFFALQNTNFGIIF